MPEPFHGGASVHPDLHHPQINAISIIPTISVEPQYCNEGPRKVSVHFKQVLMCPKLSFLLLLSLLSPAIPQSLWCSGSISYHRGAPGLCLPNRCTHFASSHATFPHHYVPKVNRADVRLISGQQIHSSLWIYNTLQTIEYTRTNTIQEMNT